MVRAAEEWPWSSAAAHCGTRDPDAFLDLKPWSRRWSAAGWRKFSGGGGNGAGVGCPSPEHSHRAGTGIGKVRRRARTRHRASAASTERRCPQKAGHQREAGRVYVPQTYPAIHPSDVPRSGKTSITFRLSPGFLGFPGSEIYSKAEAESFVAESLLDQRVTATVVIEATPFPYVLAGDHVQVRTQRSARAVRTRSQGAEDNQHGEGKRLKYNVGEDKSGDNADSHLGRVKSLGQAEEESEE